MAAAAATYHPPVAGDEPNWELESVNSDGEEEVTSDSPVVPDVPGGDGEVEEEQQEEGDDDAEEHENNDAEDKEAENKGPPTSAAGAADVQDDGSTDALPVFSDLAEAFNYAGDAEAFSARRFAKEGEAGLKAAEFVKEATPMVMTLTGDQWATVIGTLSHAAHHSAVAKKMADVRQMASMPVFESFEQALRAAETNADEFGAHRFAVEGEEGLKATEFVEKLTPSVVSMDTPEWTALHKALRNAEHHNDVASEVSAVRRKSKRKKRPAADHDGNAAKRPGKGKAGKVPKTPATLSDSDIAVAAAAATGPASLMPTAHESMLTPDAPVLPQALNGKFHPSDAVSQLLTIQNTLRLATEQCNLLAMSLLSRGNAGHASS